MKTLNDYVVTGALYQGDTGPEAQVGDQVKLFLDTEADPDFPEFVLGVIQHPIVKVRCGTATSYSIEYDPADLEGAAALLRAGDIVDSIIVSELTAITESLEGKANLIASNDYSERQIFGGQHDFPQLNIGQLDLRSASGVGIFNAYGPDLTSAAQIQNDYNSTGSFSWPNSSIGVIPAVPAYADLTAANVDLASGDFFWDTTLMKLRTATA